MILLPSGPEAARGRLSDRRADPSEGAAGLR